jgi:hypothetical protein
VEGAAVAPHAAAEVSVEQLDGAHLVAVPARLGIHAPHRNGPAVRLTLGEPAERGAVARGGPLQHPARLGIQRKWEDLRYYLRYQLAKVFIPLDQIAGALDEIERAVRMPGEWPQ